MVNERFATRASGNQGLEKKMIKTVTHKFEVEGIIPRTFIAAVEVSNGGAEVVEISYENEVIYQKPPVPNPKDWDRISHHPEVAGWIKENDQRRQAARQRAEEILGEKDWIYTEPFFRLFETLAGQ
jgi:hypothetical protein